MPTLLVLDNCEHVLDAVASLVAFLLVTTRDLRIVTTSRAPLGIAAERVFPLSQLATADGAELFRRRALAVRPDAELPDDVVAAIVARLDGLPLAVELAAARIRTMSADDVRRALDDRFELLRGRDRSAPARHQTLTAVIAWSWDLLRPDEQRALALALGLPGRLLARRSARPAGSGRPGPRRGAGRPVVAHRGRASGSHPLPDAGDRPRVRRAQASRRGRGRRRRRRPLTAWAVGLATRVRPDLFGPGQVDAVDLLYFEEANLADVLRRRLPARRRPDPCGAAVGCAGRPLVGDRQLPAVPGDGRPRGAGAHRLGAAPELEQVTVEAVALVLVHLGFLRPDGVDELTAILRSAPGARRSHGAGSRGAMFLEAQQPSDRRAAVLTLTEDPDRRTAAMAWQWAAILAENEGAIDESAEYLDRALDMVDEDTTVWEVATLNTQAATPGAQRRRSRARRRACPDRDPAAGAAPRRRGRRQHAGRPGPVRRTPRRSRRGGAPASTRSARSRRRRDRRARDRPGPGRVRPAAWATSTAAWRRSTAAWTMTRGWGFSELTTNGLEPWTLIALATDLAVHVRFAVSREQARARGGTARRGDERAAGPLPHRPGRLDRLPGDRHGLGGAGSMAAPCADAGRPRAGDPADRPGPRSSATTSGSR